MQDKKTSGTVEDSVDLARKRMLPNSYQIVKKQLDNISGRNQKKNKGVTAVKNFEFGIRMPSRETIRGEDGPQTERKDMTSNYKKDLTNFIASHQRDRNTRNE